MPNFVLQFFAKIQVVTNIETVDKSIIQIFLCIAFINILFIYIVLEWNIKDKLP